MKSDDDLACLVFLVALSRCEFMPNGMHDMIDVDLILAAKGRAESVKGAKVKMHTFFRFIRCDRLDPMHHFCSSKQHCSSCSKK